MQDHRHRLNRDRGGIMSLPVKLMITMVIIALSVPMLTSALDSSQEDMAGAEMSHEVQKFKNAANLVHFSGNGCSRTVEIDLPAGCEMSVGGKGSDAYSIRTAYNGELISTEYFESPVLKICNEMTFTGHMILKLTSVEGDTVPEIEVSVL